MNFIYDIVILYSIIMVHTYSPEHIETRNNDNYAKGGYSAKTLLEVQGAHMIGGAEKTTGSHESLMDRLKDLYIPLGLVSRRYPSAAQRRHEEKTSDACLDSNIYDQLELLIFKSKNTGTRKNLKETAENSKTKKRR